MAYARGLCRDHGFASHLHEIHAWLYITWEELTLEAKFKYIRLLQQGARAAENAIKEEPPEEAIVGCDQLYYPQGSCGKRLRGGGPYAGWLLAWVIDAWVDGSIQLDPVQDDWLQLQVVKWNGKLFSIDNRHLFIFHEYQRRTQTLDLLVRIKFKVWDSTFDRFLDHWDTRNGGVSIEVRGNSS